MRLVGVVVGLDICVRDGGRLAAGNLVCGEGEIVELARLGHRRWRSGPEFFLKKSCNCASVGLMPFLMSSSRNDRVIELDLGAGDAIGVADVVIGYADAAGDERLQAANLHLFLDEVLKIRDAHVELVLDEVHVLFIANVLAVGEEHLADLALVKLTGEIRVRDLEAEMIALKLQNGLLDELLRDAALNILQKKRRKLLLLHLLLRGSVDLSLEDGLRFEAAEDTGAMHVRVVGVCLRWLTPTLSKIPGTSVMTMVTTAAADDDGEENLDDLVVLLEDANHAWLTTFFACDLLELPGDQARSEAPRGPLRATSLHATQTRFAGQDVSIPSEQIQSSSVHRSATS